MSYLLWAIINVILAVIILYFLYRLAIVVYIKYGKVAVIVFIILLVGGLNSVAEQTQNNDHVWSFKKENDKGYFHQNYTAVLEQSPVFKIEMQLISFNDKDRKNERPMKAFSWLSGIVGYNNWIPKNISVTSKEDNFTYAVAGEIKWKLLGHTIYKQPKLYTGRIKKA